MKILIIAGGHGTRLWPLSRGHRPKQLQRFLSDRSLLQETADRIQGLVEPADIFIVVSDRFQLDAVHEQLPEVPLENILREPQQKNTMAAITLGMAHLMRRGWAKETVGIMYADHAIRNPDLLREGFRKADDFITRYPDHLVIVGVVPQYPETGYGYIERGSRIEDTIHEVFAFREKPNRELAAEYVEGGQHLWNCGLFAWRIGTMAERIASLTPAHTPILDAENEQALAAAYAAAPSTAIDYAIFEKDDRLAVLPLALEWRDIGHWEAIKEHYRDDGHVVTLRGTHVGVDSRDCLIVSETDRLIATVGLENIVIVDTPDALLVCRADQAQKIRELTDKLKHDEATRELL